MGPSYRQPPISTNPPRTQPTELDTASLWCQNQIVLYCSQGEMHSHCWIMQKTMNVVLGFVHCRRCIWYTSVLEVCSAPDFRQLVFIIILYSPVGIETGYVLNSLGLFPSKEKSFFYFSVQTDSGAHLHFYRMGTGGSFPGSKASQHLHLKVNQEMWSYIFTPSPPAFMG
jgi:hypothetical protein